MAHRSKPRPRGARRASAQPPAFAPAAPGAWREALETLLASAGRAGAPAQDVHTRLDALLGHEGSREGRAEACFVRGHCGEEPLVEAPRALLAASGAVRRRPRIFSLVAAGSLLASLWLGPVGAPRPARAANLVVQNLNDAGPGSLRDALATANGTSGLDIITFAPSLAGAITLTSGQLQISDSTQISGPGRDSLTISGNNSSRVFAIAGGAVPFNVSISGLTLSGGRAVLGGAIQNQNHNLTLDGVALSGNTATVDGGALWSSGLDHTLVVQNSLITGNTALDDGGAVYIDDTGGLLQVVSTSITGNTASGNGGGVYFYDPDAGFVIDRTTISGNTAAGKGGGVYLYDTDSAPGLPTPATYRVQSTTIADNTAQSGAGVFINNNDLPLTVENSTISGNRASERGGGLYLSTTYDELALRNTTIVSNTAGLGQGGGVSMRKTSMRLENTIVANNAGQSGGDLETVVTDGVSSNFTLSYSLVEQPGEATITPSNSLLGVDPQLGPLQENGGPTRTHLPAPASPAINAGNPAFSPPPASDQRGFARVGGGRVDIGAVEVRPNVVSFALASYGVVEGALTAAITVTRSIGDGPVSVDFATSNGTASSRDYTPASGTLSWASGDFGAKTFTVTVRNDIADEPNDTVLLALSNPRNAALGALAQVSLVIIDDDEPPPPADLQISLAGRPDPVFVSEPLTYTIDVTNTGPGIAGDVFVTDTLPANITFVSTTPSVGSCVGDAVILCDLGTFAVGQQATIRIVVRPNGAGTLTNQATVGAINPDPTPNGATATTAVRIRYYLYLPLAGRGAAAE
jgi:uncharacterized repeat protein (TIGR01451 family)